MANIKVAILNQSTVLTDAQVAQIVPALQQQVSTDFARAWGIDADLSFVPKGTTPDPTFWQMVILDNADQAGALGYHDVTSTGLPLGKVFAKTTIDYGMHWTVTCSHELLEMLGDPEINLTVFKESSNGGVLYCYEVGDACEDDQFGYTVNGVLLSDFVYPTWFEDFQTGQTGVQFDKMGHIKAPFTLLPGGYIGYYNVSSGGGWQQLTADEHFAESPWFVSGLGHIKTTGTLPKYSARRLPRPGSRRERRARPRQLWRKSLL